MEQKEAISQTRVEFKENSFFFSPLTRKYQRKLISGKTRCLSPVHTQNRKRGCIAKISQQHSLLAARETNQDARRQKEILLSGSVGHSAALTGTIGKHH